MENEYYQNSLFYLSRRTEKKDNQGKCTYSVYFKITL